MQWLFAGRLPDVPQTCHDYKPSVRPGHQVRVFLSIDDPPFIPTVSQNEAVLKSEGFSIGGFVRHGFHPGVEGSEVGDARCPKRHHSPAGHAHLQSIVLSQHHHRGGIGGRDVVLWEQRQFIRVLGCDTRPKNSKIRPSEFIASAHAVILPGPTYVLKALLPKIR